MEKIYNPAPRVVYVIFTTNKKGKKKLYSACGNLDSIKDYCNRHSIDYSKCCDNAVCGCHYLEEGKIYDGRDFKM